MISNEKSESERRALQETQTLKDEMHKTIETLNKRIFDLLEAKKADD